MRPPLHNLAQILLGQGEARRAVELFREGLTIARAQHLWWFVPYGLAGVAGALAGMGQPLPAARLFGAADSQLQSAGQVLQEIDRVVRDRLLAETRAQLGGAVFQAAREEGQALTLENAIEMALEQDR